MAYREGPSPSPYVVTAFNAHVVALEAATGRELWRKRLTGDAPRGAVRIQVSEDEVLAVGAGQLVVLRLADGETLCRVNVTAEMGISALVVGRRVYVSSSGVLSCVDLDKRAVLWSNELAGTGYGSAAIGVPGLEVQGDSTG
jgi:outer membrane protein assembly factor BamB